MAAPAAEAIRNPLCRKVVVVTRRKTNAFADSRVSEVVVNMDRLEEEVAPHAQARKATKMLGGFYTRISTNDQTDAAGSIAYEFALYYDA